MLVGLQQSIYETSENEDFVQICASIMDPDTMMPLTPADLMTLDPSFQADLTFAVSPVTALGTSLLHYRIYVCSLRDIFPCFVCRGYRLFPVPGKLLPHS